jgi:hypothetical protein
VAERGRSRGARGGAALKAAATLTGFMRCGECGATVRVVSSGNGSPRYGCSRAAMNQACSNRITVRVKVVDPLLLAGLQSVLGNRTRLPV